MSSLETRLEQFEVGNERLAKPFTTDTERAAKLLWILAVKGPHYERLIEKFPQFARADAKSTIAGLLKAEDSSCADVCRQAREDSRLQKT